MYFKIVSNGQIVDACCGLNYCKFQKKNRIWLSCDGPDGADGIISSDGSTIYEIGETDLGTGCDHATPVEIDEETYNAVRAELIETGVLPDDEPEKPEPEGEDDQPEQEPVKKSELMLKVEELTAQVGFLTECLLEMSEIVYE